MARGRKQQQQQQQQQQSEEKQKKPKPIAQSLLTIYDSGTIIGEYWIWEEDEVGKRKKWTVTGTDFFQYLYRAQPNNVRVIASCMNVQIVSANLPEDLQGPWLTLDKEGRIKLQKPEISMTKGQMEMQDGNYVANAPSPMNGFASAERIGDRIADAQEIAAAEQLGLSPSETAAALPHNNTAQQVVGPGSSSAENLLDGLLGN